MSTRCPSFSSLGRNYAYTKRVFTETHRSESGDKTAHIPCRERPSFPKTGRDAPWTLCESNCYKKSIMMIICTTWSKTDPGLRILGGFFHTLQRERMVTALSKLHRDVHQRGSVPAAGAMEEVDVPEGQKHHRRDEPNRPAAEAVCRILPLEDGYKQFTYHRH